VVVRRSRRGDTNGDLNVNNADIGGFVQALLNINAVKTSAPWLQWEYITDFNSDGPTNNADIGGFVQELLNPTPSAAAGPVAVPEPATILSALAGTAVLLFGAWRRRRANG
jgi:hypothetical protein